MTAIAPAPHALAGPLDGLFGRDVLEATDLRAGELHALLRLARALKAHPPAPQRSLLPGRTVALLFEKPSLRTRVSFEVAVAQLGGRTLFAQGAEFMIGTRETPEDAARTLSRYVDAVVVRTHDHAPLQRFARAAAVPVINALSALAHPCQAFADVLTLQERFGEIAGLQLAFVGDARNNVAASFAQAAVACGASVRFGCPATHRPPEALLGTLRTLGEASGGRVHVYANAQRAVRGADAVYTDVWTSMGDERYRERNAAMLRPYAVTPELFAHAAPHAVFLHCLPAHRGEEVSAAVIDSPCSAVFDQAENRLHAQKALLVALLAHGKGLL